MAMVSLNSNRKTTESNIGLEPAERLLTLCATISLSNEDYPEIIKILADGIDYDDLIMQADWHRTTVLLAHNLLSPEFSDSIPVDYQQLFKQIQYHNLARNLILQDELGRLLQIFEKEHISVIVLKGSALLDTVFKDISLRPMGDLDILVKPEDLSKAEALILREGYSYKVPKDIQDQTRAECRHLANLWHEHKNVMLEIHHHIVSPDEPYHFDISDFWERSKNVVISRTPAIVFSPEDMLIHLGIKFLLDRRYQSRKAIGQLSDISEIIKLYSDTLDWHYLQESSRKHGFSAGLYFVLFSCNQLFRTPLPTDFMNSLKPKDFSPDAATTFIRRRVLDMKPWLAHGLSDSEKNNTKRSTMLTLFVRLRNAVKKIFSKGTPESSIHQNRLYRSREIFQRLFKIIRNPSEFKQDIYLDRWLHDLHDPE